MVGEPPGAFAVPLIRSGCVMDNHHSGMGAFPEWPRVVGVDGITLESLHGDGFRLHTFTILGLVHSTLLVWIYVRCISESLNTKAVACATVLRNKGSDCPQNP